MMTSGLTDELFSPFNQSHHIVDKMDKYALLQRFISYSKMFSSQDLAELVDVHADPVEIIWHAGVDAGSAASAPVPPGHQTHDLKAVIAIPHHHGAARVTLQS